MTHFAVEELGEAHQAPGIRLMKRAARSSPRPSRSSCAVRLSFTTDADLVDLAPRDMHRVARERRRDAARRRRGCATHCRRRGSPSPRARRSTSPAISRSSTLPQLRPSRVDELVVEHAEAEIELGRAHPCPPFVSIISGIADTAIARIRTK